MAVTAKFSANFDDFVSAVEKAQVKLKGFQTDASSVEKRLASMGDGFNGRKIIDEAALMVKALGGVGGIAGLTDRELARVGATAAEAAQKLDRMGKEVPKDLLAIAGAAKASAGEVDKMASSWSKFGSVLGALGIGLSVATFVRFGKTVLEAGDQIQKMADQTGLSTLEVQKLNYVAGQSGTSIQSLVGAIQNLQQKLGDENSGATGALAKLGIKADEFNKLGTYQQMTLLADKIKDIKDPTEQASVASALFGKTWKEILPAIKAGMKDVADQGLYMSDQTIKSLDKAGDAWKKFQGGMLFAAGRVIESLDSMADSTADFLSMFDPSHFGIPISQVLKLQAALNDPSGLAKAMEKIPPIAKKVAVGLGDISISAGQAKLAEMDLTAAAERSIEVNKKADTAARKLREEREKHADAARKVEFATIGLAHALGFADTSEQDMTRSHVIGTAAMKDLERVASSAQFGMAELADGMEKVGHKITDLGPDIAHQFVGPMQEAEKVALSLADTLKSTLGRSLAGLNGIFQSAFEGGGGIGGAIKSFATNALEGITSLIPVIGPGISQFAGAIVAGFSKMFGGVSKEEKKARDDIQAFEKQLGSLLTTTQKAEAGGKQWAMTTIAVRDAYLQTGRSAAEAEAAVIKLWGSSKLGAEEAKKAMDEINAVLDEQKQDAADLEAAVQRYGFTIEELGPAMQRQKLDEQAQQLLNDWRLLVGSGIDLTAVNEKMAGSVQDYLTLALKTGMEVPVAFKKIIQSMIDQGTLVDENGEKITDMGQLTITWSETMSQTMQKFVDKLEAVLQKIGMIPSALNAIPTTREIQVNVNYNDPGFQGGDRDMNFAARGGLVTAAGVQYLGGGGNVLPFRPRGTDTVPAMLTPGERVLSVGQNSDYESGPAQTAALRSEVVGLRRDLAKRDRMLPKLIAAAVARKQAS